MLNARVPAAASGLPSSRRGFLSSLAALPLIGGSVALIGRPTGVAAAPDHRELLAYSEWLHMERRLLNLELWPEMGMRAQDFRPANTGAHTYQPHSNELSRVAPPSTRAALVLAAIGCDWQKDAL